MALKSFLKACARVLKLSMRPDREALWLSIKVCLIGITIIGGVGFIIKLIALLIPALFGVT